jgi:hypothetical protein
MSDVRFLGKAAVDAGQRETRRTDLSLALTDPRGRNARGLAGHSHFVRFVGNADDPIGMYFDVSAGDAQPRRSNEEEGR